MSLNGGVEAELRHCIAQVQCGARPRRWFMLRMAQLGVAAPLASVMLMEAGMAQPTKAAWQPSKRGGGGLLKMLSWQAATTLNPHFTNGSKDAEASRMFYEPLVHTDGDGVVWPILAAELPSRANGGVAADGRSVTWKLKPNVRWHDGKPFTADDVLFTWQFATTPATAAVTSGSYSGVKLVKVDAHTVRAVFDKPNPVLADSYTTVRILPRHVFEPYIGAKSREAPANLKPVGTGPYKLVDFKPGDLVTAEINADYHMPNKPYFDRIELKGGGDAVSAARAVIQTGEYDYAWNIQVEDDVLKRMEAGGKGRAQFRSGGSVETLFINASDPSIEVDGERGSVKSRHPILSDPAVRKALSLLIDRQSVQQYIYGRGGLVTGNYLHNPERFRSPHQKAEFDLDKANALLDGAGWKRGSDGIRAKDGKRLALLFQTSNNALRQKTQNIVKQACGKAGIAVELKAVAASVFFSGDVGNPDTTGKFWADLEMYTTEQGMVDPQRQMQRFVSWEASSKANKWLGLNVTRWRNDAYDAAWRAAETELDPVKRAALFIRMNDLLIEGGHVVPVIFRPDAAAVSNTLVADLSCWDQHTGSIHDWHRAP